MLVLYLKKVLADGQLRILHRKFIGFCGGCSDLNKNRDWKTDIFACSRMLGEMYEAHSLELFCVILEFRVSNFLGLVNRSRLMCDWSGMTQFASMKY